MGKGKYSNVLIIAGTGRDSGKTTLACRIIERFRKHEPVAVKISPHFHEPTDGLISWHEDENFNIYRETSSGSNKDSSRMLASGAREVYFIQAYNGYVKESFELVWGFYLPDQPIICESPSLSAYIDPGLLLLCDNENTLIRKDVNYLIDRADRIFYPANQEPDLGGLGFTAGRWFFS